MLEPEFISLTQMLPVRGGVPECFTGALSCLEETNASSLGDERPAAYVYSQLG
jgi:hypothetical protein